MATIEKRRQGKTVSRVTVRRAATSADATFLPNHRANRWASRDERHSARARLFPNVASQRVTWPSDAR